MADSWANQAFLALPNSIQLQNQHLTITNIKSEHSVSVQDYSITSSQEKVENNIIDLHQP